LKGLQGGCQVPIAGHARIEDGRLILQGLIAGLDGRELFKDQVEGPPSDPINLGNRLGERLLLTGGKEVLDRIYENTH
jgi:hydroxymethylbilane synthase